MASIAEAKLTQAKYYGEKRRYNCELYVSSLTEQFQVLNTLRRYGYAGIDEASKVRCLNAGIKTDKLNAPKAQIMSSHILQDNFDDSVGLYQDFIAQSKPTRGQTRHTVYTAQLLTKMAALEKKVSQADTESQGGEENDQDAGNAAGNANRNHKALKKPKRG
jgi:hypothetical protein